MSERSVESEPSSGPGAEPGSEHVAWREILTRGYAPSLLLACLGVWLHAADGLVVATMTPAILDEIGGADLIAWSLALYEVGSILAGVSSGLIAARRGIRTPMALAAALFAAGCAISALAPSMPVLLFGRLLQGLGGGALVAFAFVAAQALFPPRLLARALATISLVWGVSAFFGPLVGGIFVEYAGALGGWRLGFAFFAVQAVLLMLLVLFLAPEAARRGREARADGPAERFPVLRLTLITAAVLAVAAAGIEVAALRSGLLVLFGGLCVAAFLRLDARREASRLLPRAPTDLSTPAGGALMLVFFFAASTIAVAIYGPLLMIRLHGVSAFTAGYVLAIGSIAWSTAAILVSGEPERRDPFWILLGGALVAVSVPGFAFALAYGPVWAIALCAALEGAGFGMAWTFVLRRASAGVAPDEAERLSAAMPTIQRFGYALGAAGAGIVANAVGIAAFEADPVGAAETGRQVGLAVYLATTPVVLFGLYAAWRFVRPVSRSGAAAAEAPTCAP